LKVFGRKETKAQKSPQSTNVPIKRRKKWHVTLKLIYLCLRFIVPILYDVFKTKATHPHAYATLVDCGDFCALVSFLPKTFKLFGFLQWTEFKNRSRSQGVACRCHKRILFKWGTFGVI
jgi:type II secretory pathway component PulF